MMQLSGNVINVNLREYKIVFIALLLLIASGNCKTEKADPMKYTSAITFLYYKDFNYGIKFVEEVLELDLVMDQGFARVYQVNEKAFLGIVESKDSNQLAGNTLFSLSTNKVEDEYKRVQQQKVYNLIEIKYFESIPLKSFFFDDAEGHKFEIQQFLTDEDVLTF